MPVTNGEELDRPTTFDIAVTDFMLMLAATFADFQPSAETRATSRKYPMDALQGRVESYLLNEGKPPSVRQAVRSFYEWMKDEVADELKKRRAYS